MFIVIAMHWNMNENFQMMIIEWRSLIKKIWRRIWRWMPVDMLRDNNLTWVHHQVSNLRLLFMLLVLGVTVYYANILPCLAWEYWDSTFFLLSVERSECHNLLCSVDSLRQRKIENSTVAQEFSPPLVIMEDFRLNFPQKFLSMRIWY